MSICRLKYIWNPQDWFQRVPVLSEHQEGQHFYGEQPNLVDGDMEGNVAGSVGNQMVPSGGHGGNFGGGHDRGKPFFSLPTILI